MTTPAHEVLIVTTPFVDACPVVMYAGTVTSRVIVGAGFFKDIAARARDMVGGRSVAYEEELAQATETALAELQDRAAALGANCVLSAHIQTESISGKGTSMLMVSASGTAVAVDFSSSASLTVKSPRYQTVPRVEREAERVTQAQDLGSAALFNSFAKWLERNDQQSANYGNLSSYLEKLEAFWPRVDLDLVLRSVFSRPYHHDGPKSGLMRFLRSQDRLDLSRKLASAELEGMFSESQFNLFIEILRPSPFPLESLLALLSSNGHAQSRLAVELANWKRDDFQVAESTLSLLDEAVALLGRPWPIRSTTKSQKKTFGGEKDVEICYCGYKMNGEACEVGHDRHGFKVGAGPSEAIARLHTARAAIETLLAS